jgi:hypothetical protein
MASRVNEDSTLNPSLHQLEIAELVDLVTRRTGLDKGDISQALQDLADTMILIRVLKSSGGNGWLSGRNSQRNAKG